MPFLTANIDRAIVMTQYDLRGFAHPLGFRQKKMGSPKSFDATTANFVAIAAGVGSDPEHAYKPYAPYFKSSFKKYLVMCEALAEACDLSQKEAIQLIIKEFVRQNKKMRAQVVTGKREPSPYLLTLSKDNSWGKAVLALAKVFEVPLKEE